MPVKSQQGLGSNKDPDSHRAQTTMTSNAKLVANPKRTVASVTKMSSELAEVITGNKQTAGANSKSLKIIAEVDETNIEEVLNLPNLSQVPTAFLTEIQQDQAYGTIFQALKSKVPHRLSSSSPVARKENFAENHNNDEEDDDEDDDISENQAFSSDLMATEKQNDDGDDQFSIDDIASTVSSMNMLSNNNDGYDTDIESEKAVVQESDISGKLKYKEFCRQSKTIPCSYFMAHIEDRELILRYHQFSNDDIKAISRTLSSNVFVERLLLDGNYLQRAAAKYISQMITSNDFITELSLADNCLGGGEGTKEFCRMLAYNRNLKKINLSGNRFNDDDIVQLVEAFEQNKILRELDLSHNSFGEECGKVLGSFISGNDSLESIDLSWNNIRGRSAIDIAQGIKENVRLKRCNLEKNGFGPTEGQFIGDCIRQNGALEEFNINGNRLNTVNAFAIAEGLQVNDSLQILKISNNQINCDGALAIFLAIKSNESNSIREVDFSHTVVTREALKTCEDIFKIKKGQFRYSIGKVIADGLQPNSASECYMKTDEALMKRFQTAAANVKV